MIRRLTWLPAVAFALALFVGPALGQAVSSYLLIDANGQRLTIRTQPCATSFTCPMSIPIDASGNPLTAAAGTPTASAMSVQGNASGVPLPVVFPATPTFNCGTGCGGSGGTASSFGSAFPGTGTAIGLSNGTNMVAALADGSGFLKVNCSAGCSASGTTDEAAFTAGTSPFGPVGGFFQTTATNNPLTNGQQGAFQVTANRALFVNLRTAAGVEIGTAATPIIDNLTQLGGVAIALGAGATSGGTIRTTQASDSPLVASMGLVGTGAGCTTGASSTWMQCAYQLHLDLTGRLTGPLQASFTDRSGTIGTGATAQTLAPINANRNRLIIQNPCSAATQGIAAAESLFINFTTAAVRSQPSIELPPCGTYDNGVGPVSTELVSVIATTISHAYAAKEQ